MFTQPRSHFASLLWTTDISAPVWPTKTSRVRLWVKGGTEIQKWLVAVLYFLIRFNFFSNLVWLFVLVSGVQSRFVCFCWMFYCFKMFRFYYFTFSLVYITAPQDVGKSAQWKHWTFWKWTQNPADIRGPKKLVHQRNHSHVHFHNSCYICAGRLLCQSMHFKRICYKLTAPV